MSNDQHILDENHALGVQMMTLGQRLENGDASPEDRAEAGELVCAARQLIRHRLERMKASDPWGGLSNWAFSAGELLEQIDYSYSLRRENGEAFTARFPQTLAELDGDELLREQGRVRTLIELVVSVLSDPMFLGDQQSSAILERLRAVNPIRDSEGWRQHAFQISCDGITVYGTKCWMQSPARISAERAAVAARVSGWVVGEEFDYCPAHAEVHDQTDSELAGELGGGGVLLTDEDLERELALAEQAAGLLPADPVALLNAYDEQIVTNEGLLLPHYKQALPPFELVAGLMLMGSNVRNILNELVSAERMIQAFENKCPEDHPFRTEAGKAWIRELFVELEKAASAT